MRRTAAAIGALALAATVAAGCGSSSDSSDTKDAVAPATTVESTTTTTAADGPTEAELTSMLLTAQEMGSGWTVAPSSDDDSSQPSCLAELRTKGVINDPRVDIQFLYDNGAAFAFEGLTWAGEDPDETFETVTSAFDSCDDLTIESGGQQVPATLTPRTLPTMGDQSQAWAMTFTADGQPVTVDVVVATQGDILIIAMDGLAQGAVTDDGTTQFVDGAATKITRALATS